MFDKDNPALFGERLTADHGGIFEARVEFWRPGAKCSVSATFPGARAMFEDGKEYLVLIGEVPKENGDE